MQLPTQSRFGIPLGAALGDAGGGGVEAEL